MCRAAVQQSVGGNTTCSFSVLVDLNQTSRVANFAAWLAKYSGLLCALMVNKRGEYYGEDPDTAAMLATSKQLLEFGLQAAAHAAASGSGAPLRLQSYSSFIPATAGLLAALPAATLTYLDLHVDRSPWFGNMGMLTSLRRLRLMMDHAPSDTVNNCLREVGRLRGLTQLQLADVPDDGCDMQLLPANLQLLDLTYEGYEEVTSMSQALVNLQHLTSLQHLTIAAERLADGSSLPENLQSVGVCGQWAANGLLGISSLHQVTSIQLIGSFLCRENLEVLQHLPKLSSLSLNLQHHDDPLHVAPAWHSLPLDYLEMEPATMTAAEVQQLIQHVATATMLTGLLLSIGEVEAPQPPQLRVCEQLTALQHLRELNLSIGSPHDFTLQDAQHLSALVTLTSLFLGSRDSGPDLDAATLCLLALSLTRLRHLGINACGRRGVGVIHALPAIGRLTTLERLILQALDSADAQRGLQFLTGLSRLTCLIGFRKAGDAALNNFWATIKGHQSMVASVQQ